MHVPPTTSCSAFNAVTSSNSNRLYQYSSCFPKYPPVEIVFAFCILLFFSDCHVSFKFNVPSVFLFSCITYLGFKVIRMAEIVSLFLGCKKGLSGYGYMCGVHVYV